MLVDKPAGPTSHDVVRAVRRAFGLRAVGHTGTLDPFATGLLVVLLGRATRLARFVESEAKTYRATARLGHATDTEDSTGTIVGAAYTGPPKPVAEIDAAFGALRGTHRQRPPAYSAKKVAGVRSYTLARQGNAVELAAVPITVHGLELLRCQWPEVEFRCTVSAGTYVRSIARDAGEALGTGAHLTALRREAIGGLRVERATPLADVSAATPVLSPADAVQHLPKVPVGAEGRIAIGHGRSVRNEGAARGTVAIVADDQLLGVGIADDEWVKPVVVLEGA